MSEVRSAAAVKPSSGLATLVLDGFGTNVNMCFQCGRCAAGCPIAYAMDYAPAQLIHALRLGMEDVVFNSKTMWLCAACETCTTRCPQEVDIAKVMDAAKILAVRRGFKPAMSSVRAFHQAAMANIKRFGRMWEAGMIVSLKLRTGDYFKDMDLGKRMLRKGKLKLLPSFTGSRRAGRIFSRVKSVEREEIEQS
jgi:heterodisulfide reductase subunit C